MFQPEPFFLTQKRWHIAIAGCLGFVVAFGMRCNFGAAKIVMMNGEFRWSQTEIAHLESAYFYGYATSQLPAGIIATKFSSTKIFGFAIVAAGVSNIATAIGFFLDLYPVVIAAQICQGVSIGFTQPSMHGVWRSWAPPMERSKLVTTAFNGLYLGVLIGLPLSALLTRIHWSVSFLFYGCATLLWAVFWFAISATSPSSHGSISKYELDYITTKLPYANMNKIDIAKVPWLRILTSPAVWAIVFCAFARNWNFYMFINHQLNFYDSALGVPSYQSSWIIAPSQLLLAITVSTSGYLADHLQLTDRMSTETVRKVFNSIGFLGEGFFLYCLGTFTQTPYEATVFIILAAGIVGFACPGFNVNHFDIAPRYAPILMGLANGLGALAGVNNYVIEFFTSKERNDWSSCFRIASAVDLFAFAFFALFASGVEAEWAKDRQLRMHNLFQIVVSTVDPQLLRERESMDDRKISTSARRLSLY